MVSSNASTKMKAAKSAYELRRSQVSTPLEVISLFWKLVRRFRPTLGRVLDLGAGDARFASGGHYRKYDGVEIDPQACRGISLPENVRIHRTCAFRLKEDGYEACIGNPPYVRHHDIEDEWRRRAAAQIQRDLGIRLSGKGNLYLYFICLAVMKTRSDGLVALILPYEWVSRPSARAIRQHIDDNGWSVSVFRFNRGIFENVLTTASISIIDKERTNCGWQYHDVLPSLTTQQRKGISGTRYKILPYSPRGSVWARRGISPGGQKIFTLTDKERRQARLSRRDLLPCVTTLRHLAHEVKELNWKCFERNFVGADKRCWLIKSAVAKPSRRVRRYLRSIPARDRQTYACQHQKPWYRYEFAPVPRLLLLSGFMRRGPKVLINAIGAQPVGSVYGVHTEKLRLPIRALRKFLADFNFERRIVAHAGTLRKVEVAQINSVLAVWSRAHANGRTATR